MISTEVFLDTVRGGVPESLESGISLGDFDDLLENTPDVARVWAAVNSDQNRQTFRQMTEGDVVFLYHVGEGEYLGGGIVGSTIKTDWLLQNDWIPDNEERKLAYVFSQFESKSMDVQDFNELLGYQPIHHPHGLQRVANSKNRSELLEAYGFSLL